MEYSFHSTDFDYPEVLSALFNKGLMYRILSNLGKKLKV